MVITTQASVAIRCPACGRLELHSLSLFQLNKGQSLEIFCSCGAQVATFKMKKGQEVYLQVDCVLCDAKHLYQFHRKQVWGKKVLNLICADSKLDLGHLGPKEQVARLVKNHEAELLKLLQEIEDADYFRAPEVMLQAVSYLQDLAVDGAVYCSCGNPHIGMDLLPDRIELHCRDCDAVGVVYVENEQELAAIKSLKEVELTAGSLSIIEPPLFSPYPQGQTKK